MSHPNAPMPLRSALAAALLGLATGAAGEEGEKVRQLADNSFLVEEAFNQEDGVVHQISTFVRHRTTGDWVGTFTQEWPAGNESHQLSYTVSAARTSVQGTPHTGPGDLALHYRYQVLSDDAGVSLAPRVTALAPAGDASRGLGAGGWGAQTNLPLSVELGPWLVGHTNVGGTWVPDGRVLGEATSSRSLGLAQGLVLRVLPRFNLLAEAAWTRTWITSGGESARTDVLLVSPGFRAGVDFSSGLQIVTGIGVPIGIGPSAGSVAVLGYLSVELPFNEAGKRNAPGLPARSPVAKKAGGKRPDGKAPEAASGDEVAASAAPAK